MAELYRYDKKQGNQLGDYNKSIIIVIYKIALQYVQDFDSLVILFHKTKKIKGYGVANEGIVSRLVLKF
jgi:dihydroorotase